MNPPLFLPLVVVSLFGLTSISAALDASPVAFDFEKGAPVEQGWRRFSLETSEQEGPDDEAWRIGAPTTTVNLVSYSKGLLDYPLAVEPWTLEATVRVVEAGGQRTKDAFIEVMDGVSQWTIGLIRNQGMMALAYVRHDLTYQILGEVDLSSFGTVKAAYNPDEGVISVSFEGTLLGKISRADVPPVEQSNQKRVAWGDHNGAAAPGNEKSETYWKSVRFSQQSKP